MLFNVFFKTNIIVNDESMTLCNKVYKKIIKVRVEKRKKMYSDLASGEGYRFTYVGHCFGIWLE